MTVPATIRIKATLGTVRVNGRPVGPHLQRLLVNAWNDTGNAWNLQRIRREHRRRQRALHTAYRAKTKGR